MNAENCPFKCNEEIRAQADNLFNQIKDGKKISQEDYELMFNYIYGFYYDMDCAKKKMDIDAIMSLPGKYVAADGFIAVIRGVIQGEDSEYEKFDDKRSKLCNSLIEFIKEIDGDDDEDDEEEVEE